MKRIYKGMVFAFTAAILFSLYPTPAVFAAEEWTAATPSNAGRAEPAAEPPSDDDFILDEDALYMATPSEAGEAAEEVELPTSAYYNTLEDTVSTGEELMEWLSGHKSTGGTVKLTDDISLGDFDYARNRGAAPITVDTGEFSITVNGYVYLQATGPFLIRGVGGERGMLRSGPGSKLHLNRLDLQVEEGYAVFQEEGAGFIADNIPDSAEIHYADQPFVWEWRDPLTVVERGETLDAGMLPATLSVSVNREGRIDPNEGVSVTWDLTGHEEDQNLRRRFTVSGEFEGMASQTAPVCTVVYDDFPLTFLEVNVKKMRGNYGDTYRFTGGFSKPEDRLPITVAQEYSFDGENWTLDEEMTASIMSSSFRIDPFVGTNDMEKVSKIFIRLSWNDDGTVYYSNVLRYEADSLLINDEPGGNRGGGTDIVGPPEQPEPDPDPGTTPPEQPEPETTPPGQPGPETTPPETSDPENAPPSDPSNPIPGRPGNSGAGHGSDGGGEGVISPPESLGGGHGGGEESAHGITRKPDLPDGSSDHETAPPFSAPEAAPGSGPAQPDGTVIASAAAGEKTKNSSSAAEPASSPALSDPVSEQTQGTARISAAPPPSGEDAEVSAEPKAEAPVPGPPVPEPPAPESSAPGPGVLPIAAGLTVAAVSIGGAAFCLYPKAILGIFRSSRLPGGRASRAKVWKRFLGKLRNFIKR